MEKGESKRGESESFVMAHFLAQRDLVKQKKEKLLLWKQ